MKINLIGVLPRNAHSKYSRHCTKCFFLTEVEDKIGKSVPISHMSEVVALLVIANNDFIKSHIWGSALSNRCYFKYCLENFNWTIMNLPIALFLCMKQRCFHSGQPPYDLLDKLTYYGVMYLFQSVWTNKCCNATAE